MKVESILQAKGRSVETISPDADLRLVVHKLASRGIGSLIVSVDGRHVDGIISERDVVRGLNRHGQRFLEQRARDVMSRNPPTCSRGQSLQDVMEVMTRTRHRHLPVVESDGSLSGIISIGDVVKHRLGEMELEREVLRDAYVAHR
jgi:CBS domain-containing protein